MEPKNSKDLKIFDGQLQKIFLGLFLKLHCLNLELFPLIFFIDFMLYGKCLNSVSIVLV